MRRKRQRDIERDLCLQAISKLQDKDTITRLQVYDEVFERLRQNMAENTQDDDTCFEIGARLREVAIKFDL